jgi:hypothetical protein
VTLDGHPAFQCQADFDEERGHGIEVFDNDEDVVHAVDGHVVPFPGVGAAR